MIACMRCGWRVSTRARPAVLVAVVAGLVLAACTSLSPHGSKPLPPVPDQRPNIVFVLTDDLSSDLVQYMPHVLAMERAGTSFKNYFVVDSLCCPSRSAIFTGQYPHNDGVFTNAVPDGGVVAYDRHGDANRSFAVALSRSGYRVGLMGKYLNGYQPDDQVPPGWAEWDVAGNGYPEFDYRLNENGIPRDYGHQPSEYLTDVLSAKAGTFIDQAATDGTPFALEVAPFAPHRPSTPAPVDANSFPGLAAPRGPSFDRTPTNAPSWLAGKPPLSAKDANKIDAAYRKRVQSVQSIDRLIGHLEQVLSARHQLRNTYFVFSSDNGFHMGQYRLLPGKQTAFDTDIQVPLVVVGPGVPAGAKVSELASSIDLAPTFINIAGADAVGDPDGTSLLPAWHGRPAPSDWQRAVLIEHHGDAQSADDPDVQSARSGHPPSYEAMRTADSLYVEYADGEREYYDLANDPLELHNRAGDLSPSRLAALHRALRALARCHGASECQRAAAAA
jgi:N-acetylglucosamine-6-sulfatase